MTYLLVMEYHINDKRLVEIIGKFLSIQKKPKMVCGYLVDYDYDFDRLVVNIFFNKNTDQAHEFLIKEKIIEDIENYFKISPFAYSHVGDC